jgi:ribosomal protein S18 acetylase RimI-like enzyme
VDAEARRGAIAFICAIEDACAGRIERAPGGCAVLDPRHPRLWDANHLRVEAPAAPDALELDAAARLHFGDLEFQMISVLHEAVGRALTGPLRSLGYRERHSLLMALASDPPTASPADAGISEISREHLAATRIAGALERGLVDVEVGAQLVSRDALIASVVKERCFAVEAAGRQVAARCQLYSEGHVAQIENVHTVPAHRRRGFARALVTHAAREAHAAGATLVFLVADAAGWPQAFYRRAGFVDAGLLPRFLRLRG